MKTTIIHRQNAKTRSRIPYPNAATKKEILHNIVDALLSAAFGAALATIVLLLMAIA